jgi:hypothetical protein
MTILLGGQVLYVLHSTGAGEGHFRLVGEAYFYGIMDEETMKMVDSSERAIEKVVPE